MEETSLLLQWRQMGYGKDMPKAKQDHLWKEYFAKEKKVYEQLLSNPDEAVKGTVSGLAEKYGLDLMTMVGFLDGINDSLKTPNPIEEMTEDTEVSLEIDKEALYKNMVAAKAPWLFKLPQWNDIFPAEKQKELYVEQIKANTLVKPKRIYPNDPCPCGSGKKYKKCCGSNAAKA
ncbi:MAG: SEC-C domain-containing protein [Lachnospiraceae bacterium]|nr:SEC-C domain-containing protein [Lachnospiraceae bacterium]